MKFSLIIQIEAHVGSVNDLAFSYPNKLCVVTCGEDRVIKVCFVSSLIQWNGKVRMPIIQISIFAGVGCKHWF